MKTQLLLTKCFLICLMAFPYVVSAQPTAYDRVGDNYPKNESIDIINYRFEVVITDQSDEIDVVATIDARFEAAGQSELRLDLVEASEGKGMVVERVYAAEQDLRYRHEQNQLFIDLGHETRQNERLQVSVQYSGSPAKGLIIGPNKHGDFTVFSDNWSSKARHWLATVDHPYEKATNEFVVTAPAHMQVVSNGLVMEETDLADGTRLTHWKNSVPISPWLFALGVAEFAVQYVDTFEGKSIQTWVYHQDRDAGFYDFAIPTKQALAFFSDLIGPFVYEKLANIQSNSVGGGMEAASSVFYGDRSVTGNRDRRWQHIIVHEVAHQWFGNAVTEYDWNHLWLSEGFATYYTLLFREYAYGADDFVQGLKDARQRVIDYYKKDYDFQIIRDELPDLDDVSGGMIYQKGAWVLHMLRAMIGPDSYNKGVRAYYNEFINGTAHTADLRRHMEEASGTDLRKFLGQWLHQGGIPHLEGHWMVESNTLTVALTQTQEKYYFDLSVELDIVFEDQSKSRVSIDLVDEGTASISLEVEKAITDVVIDPDTKLLASWALERR